MILLTAFLVLTGLDWQYYELTRNTTLVMIGFSAGMLGFLVPVAVPLGMLTSAARHKSPRRRTVALAMAQAGITGSYHFPLSTRSSRAA